MTAGNRSPRFGGNPLQMGTSMEAAGIEPAQDSPRFAADVRTPPPVCRARVPLPEADAAGVPLYAHGCILDRGHAGQHRTCWMEGSHDWGEATEKLPGLAR